MNPQIGDRVVITDGPHAGKKGVVVHASSIKASSLGEDYPFVRVVGSNVTTCVFVTHIRPLNALELLAEVK